MSSTLVSRNVTVNGRRTSVRLEPSMWRALEEICAREGKTIHEFVTDVDARRSESSLTAAIRVALLLYYRQLATGSDKFADGPRLTGRGRGRPREAANPPLRRAAR
jgi:predicted DNA-binding ribbon-helix-helix protein